MRDLKEQYLLPFFFAAIIFAALIPLSLWWWHDMPHESEIQYICWPIYGLGSIGFFLCFLKTAYDNRDFIRRQLAARRKRRKLIESEFKDH